MGEIKGNKKISKFPSVTPEELEQIEKVMLLGSYMKTGADSYKTGIFDADSFIKYYSGSIDFPRYYGSYDSSMTFCINAEGSDDYNYYRADAGIIPVMLGASIDYHTEIGDDFWIYGSNDYNHANYVGWYTFKGALSNGLFNMPEATDSFDSGDALIAIMGDNADSVYRVNAQDYLREFVDSNAEYIYQAIAPYIPS